MTAETKLTPEQIKNWRSVLLTLVGPWALMMPDEDVQRMRDEMQRRAGATEEDCEL